MINEENVKIPNIDEFFKDDPVANLVANAVDMFLANNSEEAKKLLEEAKDNVQAKKEEQIKSLNILDYVESLSEVHDREVEEILDVIENHLEKKDQLFDSDIKLIRYYLKKLPDNSDFIIDSLTDHAIALAWRRRQFIKGNL